MISSMEWLYDVKVATGILISVAGVIDDLRSRKFHNSLFIASFTVALIVLLVMDGVSGLWVGIAGAASAFVFSLPLVLTRSMGAGDMKLLVALCVLTTWAGSLNVLIYSVFWGALLGVFQVILRRDISRLLKNMMTIFNPSLQKDEGEFHRIPYTVALLLGWMSYHAVKPLGWGIL